jgi:WD40 repeat protein
MMRRPENWYCSLRTILIIAILASVETAIADDQPAAAQPAAQVAWPDVPALRFARHDVVRWAERAKPVTEAAAQAAATLETATKAVADAKAAQAVAAKATADTAAAVPVAEQAKVAAEKALADAQEALKKVEVERKDDRAAIDAAKAAVETAQKNAEGAAKLLAESVERKNEAEVARVTADKKVPEVEPAVKLATDAKAAADKAAADVQAQLKLASDRLAAFERGIPKADPTAARLVQTITHDRPILTCRFDADGDFLFGGAQDNNFHRWDIFTASAAHFPGHKSWVGTFSFVPGPEKQIVTGGHEGKLVWWNAFAPAPAATRTIEAHKGYIRAIAVSPNGQLVATGGNDNLVRIWSAADGTLVKELVGHPRHVYNVAFDPSGKFLLSGDLMGVIKQWEVGSWTTTRELDAKVLSKFDNGFKADVGGIRSIDFSPDGKLLAVGGITDVSNAFAGIGVPAVVLIEWESGKQQKVLKPKDNFQGSIWGVRFHPSGEFLIGAGGGGAGGMWFWKTDDEKSFHFTALPAVAYDLTLHPDGLRLAVPLFDKTIRIYDLAPKFDVAAK